MLYHCLKNEQNGSDELDDIAGVTKGDMKQ